MNDRFDGLSVRSDSLSCPLPIGLDPYYNCPFRCVYCSYLMLPHVWGHKGKDFRCIDVDVLERQLGYNRGMSPLARALAQRKTLRLGNRYDPLPDAEKEQCVTKRTIDLLARLGWEFKLESKNAILMEEYAEDLLRDSAIVTPTVMIGLNDDWSKLEGSVPSSAVQRLEFVRSYQREGGRAGVLSEPFIPGYHTVEAFVVYLDTLLAYDIHNVNIYNLHMNYYNMKRLAEAGLDVEAVWDGNQDDVWRETLRELLRVCEERSMVVGCPDWVNSGLYIGKANTCCGVNVTNPCTFNMVNWKGIVVRTGAMTFRQFMSTWDGVGDLNDGLCVFAGRDNKRYSLADMGGVESDEEGGWRITGS